MIFFLFRNNQQYEHRAEHDTAEIQQHVLYLAGASRSGALDQLVANCNSRAHRQSRQQRSEPFSEIEVHRHTQQNTQQGVLGKMRRLADKMIRDLDRDVPRTKQLIDNREQSAAALRRIIRVLGRIEENERDRRDGQRRHDHPRRQ
ncbi:MAG: hypothetical protein IJH07_08955 [Ruminococcus sp.]|nr:hypothetical protein [Ruminococcus sp.]